MNEQDLLRYEISGLLEALCVKINYAGEHLDNVDLIKMKTKTSEWKKIINKIEEKTSKYEETIDYLPDDVSMSF